jgi:flagellin
MGLRINTNVPSLASQRALSASQVNMQNNLRRLSWGERITRASDDAAGLAISENLKAQIRSIRQSKRNAADSISLIQTAEGGLSEISNILIRLRELSIQAASDTMGDKERSFTNVEFQNLKDEIDRISQSNEYNGIHLLNGTGGILEFQIGVNNDPIIDRIQYNTVESDSTLSGLTIVDIDVSSKNGAQNAIKRLDEALILVNGVRANLGAKQNRLTSIINNIEISDENLSAANSRMRDVDMASEMADFVKNQILQQSGASVLLQANQTPNIVLKLLNN